MNIENKIILIKQGKNLEMFFYDSNPLIRFYVALQNYNLDELKDDPNSLVRAGVAKMYEDKRYFDDDPSLIVTQTILHDLDETEIVELYFERNE